MDALNFGCNRYVNPLRSRKDLLSSKEHEILFSNIENIKTVMEIVIFGDASQKQPSRNNLEIIIQSYKANMHQFIEEYEKYVTTMSAVESLILEKTLHPEFVKFIASPAPPYNQPLFHNFIKKPFEFYSMLRTNFQIILGQSRIDSQEYRDVMFLLKLLQVGCENDSMLKHS